MNGREKDVHRSVHPGPSWGPGWQAAHARYVADWETGKLARCPFCGHPMPPPPVENS